MAAACHTGEHTRYLAERVHGGEFVLIIGQTAHPNIAPNSLNAQFSYIERVGGHTDV